MSAQKDIRKYSRLNTFMYEYIEAVNAKAGDQELQERLQHLITEAIRKDITLVKLLKALSVSNILDANTAAFIHNISDHYATGEDADQLKQDNIKASKNRRTKD